MRLQLFYLERHESLQDMRTYLQDRLGVLVNNAGAIYFRRYLSVDGIEMNFAGNHLAYFLLTNLLLDMIIHSAPARIINVSSSSHNEQVIDFDDLECQHNYQIMLAYGKSKLLMPFNPVFCQSGLCFRWQGFGSDIPKVYNRHCPAVTDNPLAVLAELLSHQNLNVLLTQDSFSLKFL